MPDIEQVLTWLNQFDTSHLKTVAPSMLRHFRDTSVSQKTLDESMRVFVSMRANLPDPLEYPEVLLNCALAEFRHDRLERSRDYLIEALSYYKPDEHRSAIPRWMLGCVLWVMVENVDAYANWYRARQIFQNIYDQLEKEVRDEGENGLTPEEKEALENKTTWYRDRLRELKVDMICTAEEAYTDLDAHEPSHIGKIPNQFVELISQRIEKRKYAAAYQLMHEMLDLARNSEDFVETGEVYIECALAAYQMGNAFEALQYLRRAVAIFTPRSHHQAVARWMLGIVQWQVPPERQNALRSWEEAIENFQELQLQSDHHNQQERVGWYKQRVEVMKIALNNRVTRHFGRI
jgi:tetratricopeptide (TPR) repeat protein